MNEDRRKNKLDRCCLSWKMATEGINVTPRMQENTQDLYMAKTLEKMLKSMLGNYCPMCGKEL